MIRLGVLALEAGGLGPFVRARPEAIEDWLLAHRLAAVFAACGLLYAVALSLLISAFNDTAFTIAYLALAAATGIFALMVPLRRVATVMKFETGRRYLDIPRLWHTLRLAAILVLPCLLLQTLYPLKIVLVHKGVSDIDLKAAYGLAFVYQGLDPGSPVLPTTKLGDAITVDFEKAKKILDDRLQSEQVKLEKVNAAYEEAKRLLERNPRLASAAELGAEHARVSERLRNRISLLSTGEASINERIQKRLDELRVDQAAAAREPHVREWRIRELERQLRTLDQAYLFALPEVSNTCSDVAQPVGCKLISRSVELTRLRQWNLGADFIYIPEEVGATSSSPTARSERYGMRLYEVLFGWRGLLVLMTLAATFIAVIRIARLSEIRWSYVTVAMTMVVVAAGDGVWTRWGATSAPSETGLLLAAAVFFALFMLLPAAALHSGSAISAKEDVPGALIRMIMISLPTALLLMLLPEWQNSALNWPLLVAAALAVIVATSWLDNLMLERNCRPRSV